MFAIAEFGSSCRNTSDIHSDRDLLVVCARNKQKELHVRYSQLGYSVSAMTPEQLNFMKKKGSLFLQHLKYESKIILDSDSLFTNFLSECELIKPTNNEITICLKTIEFINSWPDSLILTGWKADFLYCISRDLLIKRLAQMKVVVFGLEDLEEASEKHLGIKKNEFEFMHILRQSKAAYRSNSKLPVMVIKAIRKWLNVFERIFPIQLSSSSVTSISEYHFLQNLRARNFVSSYERLRVLEAVYLILRASNYQSPDHKLVMQHIQQPNLYGSSQTRKVMIVDKYLLEMLDWLKENSNIYYPKEELIDGRNKLKSGSKTAANFKY